MDQRLVSENILQCNEQAEPGFSAHAHLIAYKTQSGIKIKAFNKEIRQCDIKVNGTVKKYFLSSHQNHQYINIQHEPSGLQIYAVWQEGQQIKSKPHAQIAFSANATLSHGKIVFTDCSQHNLLKTYCYESGKIQIINRCEPETKIVEHEGQDIVTLTKKQGNPSLLQIYPRTEMQGQSPHALDYIHNPIGIHLDRYIFENMAEEHLVQIYDIQQSKLIGKFDYVGQLQLSRVIGNILVIITNNNNVDKYYFFFLKEGLTEENILKNRVVYEKSKGSTYGIYNIDEEYAQAITSGKGNFTQIPPKKTSNVLLIYVQPKNKAKVEVMRVTHAKIRQSNYKQEAMDLIIHSKLHDGVKGHSQQKTKKQNEALQMQKVRVASSMNHRKGQGQPKKSLDEVQKQMIEQLVSIKIGSIMEKFKQLESRLVKLQNHIGVIYERIEKSIESINKEQIKRHVQNLFERVTPQFQSYFSEVFRQISGVLDQGVNYYTAKLAKQSESNREALTQVINMTFDATEEIVELGRKELKHSEATEQNVVKLLQIRKKWETSTRQLLSKWKAPIVDAEKYEKRISLGEERKQSPNLVSRKKPN